MEQNWCEYPALCPGPQKHAGAPRKRLNDFAFTIMWKKIHNLKDVSVSKQFATGLSVRHANALSPQCLAGVELSDRLACCAVLRTCTHTSTVIQHSLQGQAFTVSPPCTMCSLLVPNRALLPHDMSTKYNTRSRRLLLLPCSKLEDNRLLAALNISFSHKTLWADTGQGRTWRALGFLKLDFTP
jgi:hypothetical protein